jgi:hypothetical protein
MQEQQSSNANEICDFGLRRLLETSIVNVSRIEVFWKIVVAHFEILYQIKNPIVRSLTIEASLVLVTEVF